jgi:hypothetical protein
MLTSTTNWKKAGIQKHQPNCPFSALNFKEGQTIKIPRKLKVATLQKRCPEKINKQPKCSATQKVSSASIRD